MTEHVDYTQRVNGRKTAQSEHKEKAKSVGIAYADTLFEKMKEIEMRGINFKWETSQQGFSEVAAASLFSSFSREPKNLAELEDICKLAFKTQWFNLLEKTKPE